MHRNLSILHALSLALAGLGLLLDVQAAGFGAPVEVGIVRDKKLGEISGISASRRYPGILWAHNDGAKGRLFALRTNGVLVATFQIPARIEDAEDMAIGPGPVEGRHYLYLGDIGDNDSIRPFIRIYRFPEPEVDLTRVDAKTTPVRGLESIQLRYPDGRFDAEALLVDPVSGDILIVTKHKRQGRVYRATQEQLRSGAEVMLKFACMAPAPEASAGDISEDGSAILLRWETGARLWRRKAGETVMEAFRRPPTVAPVAGPPREPNGEAVAFDASGQGYYTLSEGTKEPIFFIPRKLP
jgi:hypothetical protein